MNLDDIFRDTARRQPEKPAILGHQEQFSYSRLTEAIEASAHALRAAGLRPGGCVGLHVPSGANCIICNYAVWRCGGCAVPLPVELAAAEKQEVCRDIKLDFVVTQGRADAFLEPFRKREPVGLPSGLLALPVSSPREHPSGFDAINSALIRFTSGTTGTSKGVVLAHETIYDRIHAANEVLRIGPDDRVLWLLSMNYHFAVSIVSYLSFGAAIILPPNQLAPAVLDSVGRHGATFMYAAPTHYAWLAGCEQDSGLSGLRLALSTTTAIGTETAERFRRRFGLPVVQALGIIEAGLPFINIDFAADRPGAVGRVLPAYRLRLEDVGLGPKLKEILVGGKGFLDAYYRPWRPRAEIMPDGWFRTGDLGEVDGDGCLFIRGRSKEVISVGGMKFFPQEVEAVLASHKGVESACVFAREDSRLGEVPCAHVVPRCGGSAVSERELQDFCRERLAGFKVPERIEFVTALRRTGSGKILHRDIDRSHAATGILQGTSERDPSATSERR
jgi:long-chain acyl-CoA synthetase